MMKKTILAASVAGSFLVPVCTWAEAQRTFNLMNFGAACDGSHDDTVAIQAWLNKLKPSVQLVAPAGVCLFSTPLTALFANDYDISGAGPYTTTFRYVGPSTATDLLTIGDTGHGLEAGVSIHDFRITSVTKMTGGYALHAHGLFHALVSNVVLDESGNGSLCGGYWFDGASGVDLVNPNAHSNQSCGDGVLVNAALGGVAELRIAGGDIGGGFKSGLHMAGGFGGLRCDGTNFHRNTYNLLVDNAVVQTPNREFHQGSTCAFDSAFVSGVLVNDAQSNGGGTIDLAGWEASAQTGAGIDIRSFRGGDIAIRGSKVFNNCQDGVYIEDPTVRVFLANTAGINGNGNSGLAGCHVASGRGWGVNAASPTSHVVNCSVPWNNAAGALSPNVITSGQCM
jgi:hypothetical protein